jgi:hypothetical protein
VDDQPEAFQEARDLEDLFTVFWRYGPPGNHTQEAELKEEGAESEKTTGGKSKRRLRPTTIWEKLKARIFNSFRVRS